MIIRRSLVLALAAVVPLSACGDEKETGDESLFEFEQQDLGALEGSTTTTTAGAAVVSTTSTTAAAVQQTTTTAVVQTTTTLPPEKQQVSVEVKIQDDDQGQYFKPSVVAVPVGGKVRFINVGTVTRSITADNGAFQSGDIAPGGVFIWDAVAAGTFNYTDDTRPYAVGSISVQ